MAPTIRPYVADDADALASFIAANEWPFHVGTRRTFEDAHAAVTGWWQEHSEIHLVVGDDGAIIGCLHLSEMDDPIPMLDIRFGEKHRGRGHGSSALRWLVSRVFTTTDFQRIEAHTRVDNLPMQGAFRKAGGWVCEGYLRHSWRGEGGSWHDALTYGAIKSDWESGTLTPVTLPPA